ncbi:protein takeout-like [Adelges cooleyi]|uniref:protein takeout-like n=1 Tax=Adelges cooleyi TaxID=133065 RepID=UPI00218008CE|nr:protein takeout-like [Adelges cooleyi]
MLSTGRIATLVSLHCLLYVFQTAGSSGAVQLPNGFVTCKRADPEVNTCIQRALQRSIPHLVKGIPLLDLLPIEPLFITHMDINQSSGPLIIKLNFKDLNIHRLSSVKIISLKSDIDKFTFNIKADFDEPLVIDALYKVQGKIIILPIRGEGRSNLTLTGVKATIEARGKPIMKNNEKYMELDYLNLKFSTSHLHVKLDNLFNGDKFLGNNMNQYLNRNWRDILKEVQPDVEATLGSAFQSIGHQFFSKLPYNQIFR